MMARYFAVVRGGHIQKDMFTGQMHIYEDQASNMLGLLRDLLSEVEEKEPSHDNQ